MKKGLAGDGGRGGGKRGDERNNRPEAEEGCAGRKASKQNGHRWRKMGLESG